jgi:hypothetical protein
MAHNDLPKLIQGHGSVLVNRWKIGIPLTEPHITLKETQTNLKTVGKKVERTVDFDYHCFADK